MKSKTIIILALIVAMLSLFNVQASASPEQVLLEVGYVDPANDQDEPQRTPVTVPWIEIDGYTLTFVTPCDGFTLQLLDENGNVAYSIVIPTNASSVILPAYLEGEYEIQIIGNSNYYFYGYITL